MNEIGRPTDEELDRMEELADQYFVGDKWGLDAKFWDDGDVHLTAYSTIGTNNDDGYPMEALHHRQLIIYEREDDECWYVNKVKISHPRPNRELNRVEIDF
jgi:hypothetical protein